ncbi:MAG TPA: DUF885 family protein, partial [Steroidobacteraceae bacterium]
MRSITPVPALLILAVALSGCSPKPAGQSADARFAAIYETEWKWRTDQQPDDEDGVRPLSDHLPRVDAATQEMRLKYWEDVQKKLAGIQRAQLSAAEQVNYDVYCAQIAVLVANQRFRDFEAPANADTTFWTDIGYTARRPFRTVEDYRHWISQMQDIPRYFHEQMDEMRAGLKRGFTPPKVTMQGRDASLTAVTEATPEASLFYTPFAEEMPGVPKERQAELKAAAVKTIKEVVQPAYVQLLNFMRNEYVPNMRTTLAAQELPDGKAFYRAKILEFTTLDMDPAEIHKLGEAEVQ